MQIILIEKGELHANEFTLAVLRKSHKKLDIFLWIYEKFLFWNNDNPHDEYEKMENVLEWNYLLKEKLADNDKSLTSIDTYIIADYEIEWLIYGEINKFTTKRLQEIMTFVKKYYGKKLPD